MLSFLNTIIHSRDHDDFFFETWCQAPSISYAIWTGDVIFTICFCLAHSLAASPAPCHCRTCIQVGRPDLSPLYSGIGTVRMSDFDELAPEDSASQVQREESGEPVAKGPRRQRTKAAQELNSRALQIFNAQAPPLNRLANLVAAASSVGAGGNERLAGFGAGLQVRGAPSAVAKATGVDKAMAGMPTLESVKTQAWYVKLSDTVRNKLRFVCYGPGERIRECLLCLISTLAEDDVPAWHH